MKPLNYHPACLLFPPMGEQEIQELAADINERGLLNPVVLFEGKVLDGRSRLAACKIAGVKPRFIEWDGQGSPTEWVLSQNLFRRHLTSSQRAMVAYQMLPMLEKEAKERQRLSRGRGMTGKKRPTFSSNGKASQVAARITKTNENYVKAIKAISADTPDLMAAIRSGKLRKCPMLPPWQDCPSRSERRCCKSSKTQVQIKKSSNSSVRSNSPRSRLAGSMMKDHHAGATLRFGVAIASRSCPRTWQTNRFRSSSRRLRSTWASVTTTTRMTAPSESISTGWNRSS